MLDAEGVREDDPPLQSGRDPVFCVVRRFKLPYGGMRVTSREMGCFVALDLGLVALGKGVK